MIMLRIKRMVWYTDGPLGVVEAHSVQMLQTERRRVLLYFLEQIWKWRRNNMPVRWPYRNHIDPREEVTSNIAHFFSPIDSELFEILHSIDKQAHIMTKNSTTRPPTPFL